MKFKCNFKKTLAACLVALISLSAFAAENENQNQKFDMLDVESELFYQDIPIKQGVNEFEARLEKIRSEEGREPLGLILCGGSARAFCHTGVLRAMEENQVRPDFIVANSMGAIIGLLYSFGFSPEKIEEIIGSISLTSYFDIVMPAHGGLINVRKYEALINSLLGKESHDLKDCEIPVLILAEDLYSKRQVWFASGDYSTIMNAAFSMPVFMEPIKTKLEDGTAVCLTDAGSLDIGGIKVAEAFSDNLIISTAFYDKALNYNNPLIIINRTISAGKERIVVNDIKNFKPVVIRNDVEHFSFMEFDKAKLLGEQGYKSANEVMDKIVQCPHGFKIDEEWRKKTDALGDQMIFDVKHDIAMPLARPYFGVKIWPVFSQTDFDDFYIYQHDGILLSVFEDFPLAKLEAGITYPFGSKGLSADVFFDFNASSFSGKLMASYFCDFSDFTQNSLYGAGKVAYSPKILPAWIKEFYLTGEYLVNLPINTSEEKTAASTTGANFTTGVTFDIGNPVGNYVNYKGYLFLSGKEFLSMSYGGGCELRSNWNMFKYFGVSENASARYAFGNVNSSEEKIAPLFFNDFFRAQELPAANAPYSVTSSSEIYFVKPDCTWTLAEFIIIRQLKLGGFFDLAYTKDFNYCAGGFVRSYVSFIGLSDFMLEGGCGWDFNDSKVFGFFSMRNRM